MKKLKQLLIIALVCVMTFTLAACGSCDSCSSCGGKTVTELSVNTSSAKTSYYVGEEFSSDGIVVTATYEDESTAEISSDKYTVDSSAYDGSTVGSYDIVVSYKDVSTTYTVKVILAAVTALTLNTGAVKTLYGINQNISYTGLTATATYADGNTATIQESDLVISSDYDRTTAGDYDVNVSYTFGGATKSATYSVTVLNYRVNIAGLEIVSGETFTSAYTLSTEAKTANLDATGLSVYTVDENGQSATALDSSSYYLTYFNSTIGEWVEDPTAVTQGLYEIWANVDYDLYTLYGLTDDDGGHYIYTASNCVQVQVNDTLSTLTFVSGTQTQEASRTDLMSSTWEFTLTFESGNTETRYGTDSNFTFSKIYPSVATTESSAPADVTYTFTNAAGVVSTASTTVSYTITGELNEIEANITELVDEGTLSATTYSVETTLVSGSISVTADSSNTVEIDSNSKSIDGYSFKYRLKLGGAGTETYKSIKLETTGAATITVYMMSSSGSASRQVGLYDSGFSLIGTAETVGGSVIEKHTYTIESAGTYYLAAASGGTNIYYVSIGYSS